LGDVQKQPDAGGMSCQLRPYQVEIIDQVRTLMRRGVRSILVQSPTGSGKTLLTAHMLGNAASRGMSSVFIVHRRELLKQSIKTFAATDLRAGIVASGFPEDYRQPVQIASVQTLAKRYHRLKPPKLIVWDECFPAGTLVSGVPIETIKAGDYVDSYNETSGKIEHRRVMFCFQRKAPSKIIVVNDRIACTENHPFLTNDGWVPSGQLKKGDIVYVLPRLSGSSKERSVKKVSEMLSDRDVGEKSDRSPTEDAAEESDVDARGKRPHGANAAQDWALSKNSYGQWPGNQPLAECVGKNIKTANGSCRSNGNSILLSNTLQDRHSRHRFKVGDRGGRKFPWAFREKVSGQEEGEVLERSRVDSVKVYQQSDKDGLQSLCPDGFVYNLEIEGNNNYFAEGFLVHNCHHVAAGSWSKIYSAFPDAFHIGLTATPERLDGTGLRSWFSEMVKGPSVSWLIENKYLAPYRLYAPAGISTQNIKTQMGDFAKAQLVEAADKPRITGDAIKHYFKYAKGKRAVVFCVSIEHSKHVVEQFVAAGIPAEHVDGETETEVRDAAIKRFESGETLVLSNVELFGEGFDLPAIEAAILLRPTKSLGLYLQECGRVLRPCPGKSEALILDHAGNCQRHGLPDEERDWSLEGWEGNRKRSKGDTATSVKICPRCFAAQFSGLPSCRFCGHTFLVQSREVEQVDGELVEVDPTIIRRQKLQEQGQAQSFEDLVKLGERRGYKRAYLWAKHLWNHRQAKKLAEGRR
jgi:DNA repair protein RadD